MAPKGGSAAAQVEKIANKSAANDPDFVSMKPMDFKTLLSSLKLYRVV
jgi:hypothetical protein